MKRVRKSTVAVTHAATGQPVRLPLSHLSFSYNTWYIFEVAEIMEERQNTPDALDALAGDSSQSTAGSDTPAPLEVPDETLGGYQEVHTRSPAFEGSDGQPYTVSIEVESVGDPRAPYVAYLVFPRWAENGLGIVGHLETPVISTGKAQAETRKAVDSLPLSEVKRLLEEAILRKSRKQ